MFLNNDNSSFDNDDACSIWGLVLSILFTKSLVSICFHAFPMTFNSCLSYFISSWIDLYFEIAFSASLFNLWFLLVSSSFFFCNSAFNSCNCLIYSRAKSYFDWGTVPSSVYTSTEHLSFLILSFNFLVVSS